MELEINLKRLGKKKIYKSKVTIHHEIKCLKDLIETLVRNNVRDFNNNIDDTKVLAFLTPLEIQTQSESGKIGFNSVENKTKADISKSIKNALQAFEDGIFLVFIDDDEIQSLNEKITLKTSSTIVFIRMTFLAGTYW